MGLFFLCLGISFVIIFLINAGWSLWNLYVFANEGIQTLFVGKTFGENIISSAYFKWILLVDALWWIFFIVYLKYSNKITNNFVNYLKNEPIKEPKICFVTFTYNEAEVIESILKDLTNQKYVTEVLVIDNHSTDSTVQIAKKNGARVITKEQNMGLPHSWVLGQKEALKTDANIIVIIEADGTCSGKDVEKMLPYLDHCDAIITTRQEQVLTEKGNQNNTMHTWGNYIIASILQLKFFNFKHRGLVHFNDAACIYRCFRREALEKVIKTYENEKTGKFSYGVREPTTGIFTTCKSIECGLRIVQIPITFKKRIGISKSGAEKKNIAFRFGLDFIWFLLRS